MKHKDRGCDSVVLGFGLTIGDLMVLDDPAQRGSGTSCEQGEAYTFTSHDIHDARVALQPGFVAVRTLTMAQCLTNADTWTFFCADAAGR